MRHVLLLAFVCLAWLGGSTESKAAPLDDVMNADRAFAASALRNGTRAAFLEYAAPDATMFRDGVGPIKGHTAIGGAFREKGGAVLEWWPENGEVAASGDLGYTWGYAKWTAPDGKSGTSNYVSIWRKMDGQWKWIVDLGVEAPPKAK